MKNPLNTLFGRIALLSGAVMLATQLSWLFLLIWQRPHHDMDGFARGMLLALRVADQERPDPALPPTKRLGPELESNADDNLTAMLRVRRVPAWNLPASVHLHPLKHGPLGHLTSYLSANLPPGTQIAMDDARPPQLWVRFPESASWTVLPIDMPPPPRFVTEVFSMLSAALILSFLAAWQIQRPLARVAQAARRFGTGERIAPLTEQGPDELRELCTSFNDMMRCVNGADDDRVVMLTGVAHDLRTPLTRLKLRTRMLAIDPAEREGLLHDIDSLAHIVQQFLEFARHETDGGEPVGVDNFLMKQFGNSDELEGSQRPLFELELRAGPQFVLPATTLGRLMTNIVDNALEYGEPPIEITTSNSDGNWHLCVRDHGAGIAPDRIASAVRPFVRLSEARGGEGHCGLGLAVVARLVRDNGWQLTLDNHAEGGLDVRLSFPATR